MSNTKCPRCKQRIQSTNYAIIKILALIINPAELSKYGEQHLKQGKFAIFSNK
jgi:hypothetical protein